MKNSKLKTIIKNLKFCILSFGFTFYILHFTFNCFAQQTDDLEFSLDVNSPTIALPKIFKPNIDLSGRGFHRHAYWPQGLAAAEVLDTWQKEI